MLAKDDSGLSGIVGGDFGFSINDVTLYLGSISIIPKRDA
jgi:hypothetical protein